MKKLITIMAAAVAVTSFNAIQADPWEGFYVGALGGANWLQTNNHHHRRLSSDVFVDGANFRRHRRNRNNYNTGYAVGAFGGYRWCEGLRVEAEVTYRSNQANGHHRRRRDFDDLVDGRRFRRTRDHNRRHSSVAFMANALYDFDLSSWDGCGCEDWGITPYLGAGIGYARAQLHTNRDCFFGRFDRFDREDFRSRRRWSNKNRWKGGFAWQLIAGISYAINCNWDIALEYRFHRQNISRDHHRRHDGFGSFSGSGGEVVVVDPALPTPERRHRRERGNNNFSNHTLDLAVRYHY